MTKPTSVEIVETFFEEVWQSPQNPDAIDRLVADDFLIVSGGVEIRSRAEFKKWVVDFQSKISDLEFEVLETFQNEDGSRVVSRWRVTGKNNGMMGTAPNQAPFTMQGTAVFAVLENGLLHRNWVERNALEVLRDLERSSHDATSFP